MGEKEHNEEIRAMPAHKESGAGCVIRCRTDYAEGNPHSHRWNAAQQARSEPDVYKLPDQPARYKWPLAKWLEKLSSGLVAGGASGITHLANGQATAGLTPWKDAMSPFPHNAHHLIPVSVLWKEVIEAAVDKAEERTGEMFNLVVGGMLKEPYNHNDQPNMVVLPTVSRESRQLGLPMHLEGKQRNHPEYSKVVAMQVKAEVPPKYNSLASQLNSQKHEGELAPVAVRPTLVAISKATYAALMGIARAQRGANQTLDDMATEIGQSLAEALPKLLAGG
jgi:hypothetical protein